MRMSRGITLTVLAAATLSACVCAVPWGRRPQPDRTWHDAAGNPVAEHWKTDETGKRRTYSNACFARLGKAKDITPGECPK